jgi:hypothetical protein
MTTKKNPTLKEKEQAAKKAEKWAGAGQAAFDLAKDAEKAKLDGTKLPATNKNIAITLRGSGKIFMDGDIISESLKKQLTESGLDMTRLRQSITEQVLARAIQKAINTGSIPMLNEIAAFIGEETDPAASGFGMMPVRYMTMDDYKVASEHILDVIGRPKSESNPETAPKKDE